MAFNYAVRPATADEREPSWARDYPHGRALCRHGRNYKTNPTGCEEPVAFICTYDYVTGRAGRVSRSSKGKCQAHAEAFAKRHKIDMPEEVTT